MLALPSTTKLRVLGTRIHTTNLASVSEIGANAVIFDWYGSKHNIEITEGGLEELYIIAAVSGEPIYVGESHMLLAREKGKARYRRYSIKHLMDMNKPVYIHLPQRKITLDDDGPFNTLTADEKSIHLATTVATDLLKLMTTTATAGVAVNRSRKELRIDLEKNRPVCFATKLINGNFDENLEGTLEELCSSAIINTHGPLNDQYIEKTEKTGIIFEGSSLFNDVVALPPRPVAKKAPVYHIKVEDDAPVELAWFCT